MDNIEVEGYREPPSLVGRLHTPDALAQTTGVSSSTDGGSLQPSTSPEPEEPDEALSLHEPTDKMMACLRLELRRPEYVGDPRSVGRAWKDLRAVRNAIGQGLQRAIGDVVLHVRNLRAAGKTRFATPVEKADDKLGIPLPAECYADNDIKPLFSCVSEAMKKTGTSEYVYASVARKVSSSELTGTKLKGILRGEQAYPVLRRFGVMMRSRNWSLACEKRTYGRKEVLDVAIETSALRPGGGKMRFVCASLHGPKLKRAEGLLKELAALGTDTEDGKPGGWSKGALTIVPLRRPGQEEKWFLLVPYSAPRVERGAGGDVTVSIHRSVANMLTAAVYDPVAKDVEVHHFPGRDVVLLKHQMYARRATISRDLAAMPHRGRGGQAHHKALARLSDKEKRATDTNIWRAARWAQTIVENAGASKVFLDNFTSFDPDLQDKWIAPYVRRFPFAEMKMRIIDAITRRAGIGVQEYHSYYISQECPGCGHTEKANIARLPKARGVDVEKGWFTCVKCKFATDLDEAAARNGLKRCLSAAVPGKATT